MTVAVIGAGPAGLMAAETIARAGLNVTVYDRMPSAGRKFMLAGRGGLNLTHSEALPAFLSRYGAASALLHDAIAAFSPDRLRTWSEELGQPTFVGSSGRVFPQAFKASPLLRAWLRRLDAMGVQLLLRHRWCGWTTNGDLHFETPQGALSVAPSATVLALGGASWPRLGSDGGWATLLGEKGVGIAPLQPANCGFRVAWSNIFRDRFEGQPLKTVQVSFAEAVMRGDVMITRDGIEGGAVYALAARLRDAVLASGKVVMNINLRPDLTVAALEGRLSQPRGKQSLSTFLRKAAGLSPVAAGLLQEVAIASGETLASMTPARLAALINAAPLRLTGLGPLARAISTAGGVTFDEIDSYFMLRKMPGVFVAGEMLDWEAPTGGYLLQASFATGAAAGRGVVGYIKG